MIWVPLFGIIIATISYFVGARKTSEICGILAALNIICTAIQIFTNHLMFVGIFVVACFIGVYAIRNKGFRLQRIVLMVLLLANMGVYGSYFIMRGGNPYWWLFTGNILILAMYSVCVGGLVYEFLIRNCNTELGNDPEPGNADSRNNNHHIPGSIGVVAK